MGRSPRIDQRAWVGIDIGTQSVRAIVCGADGTVLGTGSAALRSRRPADGRHEQDPQSWWDAVGIASRQAMAGLDAAAVAGVACCGTSGTILLVAATGTDPAAPRSAALMYDDARAVDEAATIRAQPAEAWRAAGLSPQQSWALPKAIWLQRDTGDTNGLRLAHQVDLVNSRLAGRPVATDTSNALKSGIDPVTARWPMADLERLGLDVALLPALQRPGSVLGTLCAAAAAHTGLPSGVPIVAGMTDGCAAQIAAGVLRPGQWNFVVGTTTVLKGVSDALLRDPTGAVYSHSAPDGRWWPGGASSAGAGALSHSFDSADFAGLEALAAEREPAGSVVYPLTAIGERFPFRRADAHRLELGTPADDADRYAAILQGVAYVQRLCLDHVRGLGADVGATITVTGGAAKSRYWTQLQSDILGREVRVPRLAEGAVGMAMLAAAHQDDLATSADRMAGPMTSYRPRPGAAERFEPGYVRLRDALRQRGWLASDSAREGAGA